MRWQGQEGSGNVEDRRSMTGPIAVGGGLIGVIALIVNLLTGGDIDTSQLQLPGGNQQLTEEQKAEQDSLARFSDAVLNLTQKVWHQILPEQANQEYEYPKLVLFSNGVQSGCGNASSAMGPFYCPADQKLYIDLSFFRELRERFGASGDFAMAYVIAHEVGHHVQYLLGTSQKMDRLRQQLSETEYNKYSVRLELQADYYAGVWAHYMQGQGILEAGDMNEAINAAQAIGDDKLTGGQVPSERFTHGTSAQRMYWLRKGYETGDIKQGDTFNATDLH